MPSNAKGKRGKRVLMDDGWEERKEGEQGHRVSSEQRKRDADGCHLRHAGDQPQCAVTARRVHCVSDTRAHMAPKGRMEHTLHNGLKPDIQFKRASEHSKARRGEARE